MSSQMQDPTQPTMDAIDSIFRGLRDFPFSDVGNELADDVPQEMDPGNGQIQPVGFIADGAIDDIAAFAATIRPPVVVSSLPALPDTTYPQGSFVFLTTDMKLYRNTTGSAWSKAVDGADIVADSITAGQIAAGAIGTSELSAGAVIANVANVGGTVTIDSTGITITNGKLTLSDVFGQNALTGAGFGASWYDFITKGVYNAAFGAGTAASLAVTETGGADTSAEYAASLSSVVPYWVVAEKAGTVQRIADSTASSGFVVRLSGSSSNLRMYQDVPVTPGQIYSVIMNWKHDAASTKTFSVTAGIQPVDADHLPFSTQVSQALVYSSGALADYDLQLMVAGSDMPAKTRYARIEIEVTRISGSPTISIAAIQVEALRSFGPHIVNGGVTVFDDTMGIGWDDGSGNPDAILRRTGTHAVSLQDDFGGITKFTATLLRATSSSDASVSSSTHGLQVGPDSTCIKVDGNEIMAVGSALRLQNDGVQDVQMFGSTARQIRFDAALGYIEMNETSAVSAGGANTMRLFVRDSGGKTQLAARFPSGAVQAIATEP